MGIFGKKKISYLGVDLGVGGVKVVELRNEKGRARLVTYGFTERLPDAQPLNLVDDPVGTANLLRAICRKARVTTPRAVASLPIAAVFSSVINVPKAGDKDIREAIQWQARKLIPVPLEEMVLDFKPITPIEPPSAKGLASKQKPGSPAGAQPEQKAEERKEQQTVQVLITGAAKNMVNKVTAVFKAAGLVLDSLDAETFALIRSLVGKDRAPTMIVDIGAVRTNIVISENGVPYVTRSLDMGGASFTKAMSRTLNMDLAAAEKTKCDIKGISSLYPGEGLPRIFEASVGPLVTELQYSMNLYSSQGAVEGQAEKRIEKIVLTGGGSALPQLAEFLASELNLKTYVGDPWARVIYPDGLRPILDEIGYRFAVGVGLAMRDIE